MDKTINANLNNADCIKSTRGILETHYYNICTGTKQDIPNGIGDIIGITTVLVMLLAMVVFVYKITRY